MMRPSSVIVRQGFTRLCGKKMALIRACRSTRKIAYIARLVISRIPLKIFAGSPRKAAAGQIIRICKRIKASWLFGHGHWIFILPSNLCWLPVFYRMHLAGKKSKNGPVLDKKAVQMAKKAEWPFLEPRGFTWTGGMPASRANRPCFLF